MLAAFDVQVFPGKRLLLRPRARDQRSTAAARVRRWPWLPACEAVGCVSARVMGAGNDARVDVVLEAALPGPVRILLGCSEGQGPDRFLVDPGDEQTSSYHHVIVELPGEIPRSFSYPTPNIEGTLSGSDGQRCHALTVLDVAPFAPLDRPGNEARLSLVR